MKRKGAKGEKGAKGLLGAERVPRRSLARISNVAAESDEGVGYDRAAGRAAVGASREPDAKTEALARAVIGAAISVHRELGPGYPEVIYQRALAEELKSLALPFTREKSFAVRYRGVPIGEGQLDFLVGDRLVVELKAVETVLPVHRSQVFSYLKALDLELGLLLNFNAVTLKRGIERIVRTSSSQGPQ